LLLAIGDNSNAISVSLQSLKVWLQQFWPIEKEPSSNAFSGGSLPIKFVFFFVSAHQCSHWHQWSKN